MCLPLKTLSHFPLNIGFPSFFDSWWLLLSPQLRSGLWSSEFSSSDQYEVLQTFSIVNNLSVHCFGQFLSRTKPRQSEAEQSPAILTCTILSGSHLNACRLFIMKLDPIERRSLQHCHSAKVFWTNLRVLVPVQKLRLHGNARRSCPQSVSLVRIGRIFEHAALRHLLFCGIKCACREVSSMQTQSSHQAYRSQGPVHCEMRICWFRTYFGVEVGFEISCVRKPSQMQFWDWKCRKINHATVRISSTSMIYQSTSTLEAWCRYWSSHFTFRLHCISRHVRSQFSEKRMPNKNRQYSVSCGNPESRQGMVQNRRSLIRNVGRSRAARCFRIAKILSHLTENLLCSVNPEFESTIDSQSQDSFFGALSIHQFFLVLLGLLFLRNKFFFGKMLLDFLGGIYSSFPFLQTSLFYFFESDQPFDSPVPAGIVWIQTPDWSQKEQYQNFFFPNVSVTSTSASTS